MPFCRQAELHEYVKKLVADLATREFVAKLTSGSTIETGALAVFL